MFAVEAAMSSFIGSHQPGRAAMSAKARPGSRNTLTSRPGAVTFGALV